MRMPERTANRPASSAAIALPATAIRPSRRFRNDRQSRARRSTANRQGTGNRSDARHQHPRTWARFARADGNHRGAGRDLRRPIPRRGSPADGDLPRSGRRGRGLSRQDARKSVRAAWPREFRRKTTGSSCIPSIWPSARRCTPCNRPAWRIPIFAPHERVTNDTTQIAGRRVGQFLQLQLSGHVGRSGRLAGRQGGDRPLWHERLGQPAGVRRKSRASRTRIGACPASSAPQDAIVYVGGHSTNETTIGHLFGPGDLVLHDALAHNSIIQGCILSGARRRPFPHNDWHSARSIADRAARRISPRARSRSKAFTAWMAISRSAPLHRSQKAAQSLADGRRSAFGGRAWGRMAAASASISTSIRPTSTSGWERSASRSAAAADISPAAKPLVEYLKYTSPGFVYSVGISPLECRSRAGVAAAARGRARAGGAAVRKFAAVLDACSRARIEHGHEPAIRPVVPVILGNSLHSLQLSQALFARGINVQPILYPAVEEKRGPAAILHHGLAHRATNSRHGGGRGRRIGQDRSGLFAAADGRLRRARSRQRREEKIIPVLARAAGRARAERLLLIR